MVSFTKRNNCFCLLRSLCVFVLLLSLISCANLKRNYLGKAKRDPAISKISAQQLSQLDIIRKHLDLKTDSFLQVLSIKKHNNRHLSATEINKLYSDFRVQLDFDRIFNSILQTGRKKTHLLHCNVLPERTFSVRLSCMIKLIKKTEVFEEL